MVAYLRTFLSECFLTICPVFWGVRRPQNDLKASGNYAYGDSSHSKLRLIQPRYEGLEPEIVRLVLAFAFQIPVEFGQSRSEILDAESLHERTNREAIALGIGILVFA